jgi:phosphoglycerate kinase
VPKFRTLDDIDVRGKRVLLRADLNVPMKNDVVSDATRIDDNARQIQGLARRRNCRMFLPEDVVVAPAVERGVATRTVAVEAVPSDMMILDIGPNTVSRIGALLEEAHTLVWNGPLGAFETPPFDRGTIAVAKRAAELTRAGRLLSVAGGGDTVAALDAAGVANDLSYVSTAGGAFLEWLERRELPGVAALAPADGK